MIRWMRAGIILRKIIRIELANASFGKCSESFRANHEKQIMTITLSRIDVNLFEVMDEFLTSNSTPSSRISFKVFNHQQYLE